MRETPLKIVGLANVAPEISLGALDTKLIQPSLGNLGNLTFRLVSKLARPTGAHWSRSWQDKARSENIPHQANYRTCAATVRPFCRSASRARVASGILTFPLSPSGRGWRGSSLRDASRVR